MLDVLTAENQQLRSNGDLLKIEKVQFLKILCIPSKHWGWSAIALGIGCLHSDRKYIGISPLQRKALTH